MLGLVETHVSPTGKLNSGHGSPPRFFDFGTVHALGTQCRHLRREIVAHEVQLGGRVIGRVYRHLGWRQRKDQPAVAGIYGREAELVSNECTISIGILGVQDDVGAEDHGSLGALGRGFFEDVDAAG